MLLELACVIMMSIWLGMAVELFWRIFDDVADNSEIPDKPLRPDYIVKELTKYD